MKPKGWEDNGKVIVFTHGGGYTQQSALSSFPQGGQVADATGIRVLGVDYTLVPHAKWQEVTDQVVTVFEEILKQGYTVQDIAIFGDSAVGGLAAGCTLKMRDLGMGMPAAVALWSPFGDVTCPGDTYTTLKDAEPFLTYDLHIKACADAYAAPEDQKHPYVSPVYGDYSKGFPPTLIQGGVKEHMLSTFVRLYQAMDMAGVDVKLDLYEGMPHVFQATPHLPESKVAVGKTATFLKKHLQ
jgi:acetyl esterase/lipase